MSAPIVWTSPTRSDILIKLHTPIIGVGVTLLPFVAMQMGPRESPLGRPGGTLLGRHLAWITRVRSVIRLTVVVHRILPVTMVALLPPLLVRILVLAPARHPAKLAPT